MNDNGTYYIVINIVNKKYQKQFIKFSCKIVIDSYDLNVAV